MDPFLVTPLELWKHRTPKEVLPIDTREEEQQDLDKQRD